MHSGNNTQLNNWSPVWLSICVSARDLGRKRQSQQRGHSWMRSAVGSGTPRWPQELDVVHAESAGLAWLQKRNLLGVCAP